MTIARRGRSTKIADNIASAPVGRWRKGRRPDRYVPPQSLQSFDDDQFASGQSLLYNDAGADRGTRFDAPYLGFAVARDEDVDAFLIGNQRGLRNNDLLLGGSTLQRDADQLAVDQRKSRIGEGGAREHRVGAP